MGLPALSYRYASFAVAGPEAAASFFEEYTGASRLAAAEHQPPVRRGADVVGSRLAYASGARASHSDVYFVSEPGLPCGGMCPAKFGKAVDDGHTMAQGDWDWHLDWHLAFSVKDIDAVAARLMRAGVPFVNDVSLFFAIPGTGITIQVLGLAQIYWTEPHLFCRETSNEINGRMQPYPMNITSLEDALSRPMPQWVPAHQSMTSAGAAECAAWVYGLLPVMHVHERTEPSESHAYADGTCADIRWMAVSSGGWEMHFVQQYSKRQGAVRVADHERFVRALRGNTTGWDAYMHFRVAFEVDDLAPYRARFDARSEHYLFERATGQAGARIFVSPPNGYTFELFEKLPGEDLGGPPDGEVAREAIADDEVSRPAPAVAAALREASRLIEV